MVNLDIGVLKVQRRCCGLATALSKGVKFLIVQPQATPNTSKKSRKELRLSYLTG